MAKRLRGKAGQQRRKRVLTANPVCQRCGIRFASEADHIIALVNGGPDTEENMQGLCEPCHADKTHEDMGRPIKGAVNGIPLDPNHHWNIE